MSPGTDAQETSGGQEQQAENESHTQTQDPVEAEAGTEAEASAVPFLAEGLGTAVTPSDQKQPLQACLSFQ